VNAVFACKVCTTKFEVFQLMSPPVDPSIDPWAMPAVRFSGGGCGGRVNKLKEEKALLN
jgi:hypothetical protein